MTPLMSYFTTDTAPCVVYYLKPYFHFLFDLRNKFSKMVSTES